VERIGESQKKDDKLVKIICDLESGLEPEKDKRFEVDREVGFGSKDD